MGQDFSIRPHGAPAAVPVQPANVAAEQAVATELPAHQSVVALEATPRLRNDPQGAGGLTSKRVMLDRDAGEIVTEVVDNRTSLVLKQFPDQGMLRRRAYARALQQARDAALALRIDLKA